MSNRKGIIPKEQQTAYERWEMVSFDASKNKSGEVIGTVEEASASDMKQLLGGMQAEAVKRGYEEGWHKGLTEGREEGQEQGYRAGYEAGYREGQESGYAAGREKGEPDGHAKGYEEGEAQGYEAGWQKGLDTGHQRGVEDVDRMRELATVFAKEIAQANENVASEVLRLSLDIAKAMLKTALKVKPELVLPIVTESIRYLPSVQQPAMLYLHPEDAALVKSMMKEELSEAGWRIVEEDMPRGGCRVETATNQVDASLETRWNRIITAFGQDSDWIET